MKGESIFTEARKRIKARDQKRAKMLWKKESIFKMLTALSRSRRRRRTVFKKKEPKGVGKELSAPSVHIQANAHGPIFFFTLDQPTAVEDVWKSRRGLREDNTFHVPEGVSITRRNDGGIEIFSPGFRNHPAEKRKRRELKRKTERVGEGRTEGKVKRARGRCVTRRTAESV